MLARAKANLRACAVVGLTERFDESMMLLKKAYGWKMPFYERKNTSIKRPFYFDLWIGRRMVGSYDPK